MQNEIRVVKHPERRGKTIVLKYQHLRSVTEMSSQFKDLKSTKNADESKGPKLRNIKDDDFRDQWRKNGTALSTPKKVSGKQWQCHELVYMDVYIDSSREIDCFFHILFISPQTNLCMTFPTSTNISSFVCSALTEQ